MCQVIAVRLGKFLLLVLLLAVASPGYAVKPVITIGIVDNFPTETWPQLIGPTLENLRESLPNFSIKAVDIDEADEIGNLKDHLDFLITTSVLYWEMHLKDGASAVAVVAPAFTSNPQKAAAGLLLVNSSKTVKEIEDLRGSVLAVPTTSSSMEYLALKGLLEEHGENAENFFKEVKSVGWRRPGVVSALMGNSAEVGILGLCELETLIDKNIVPKNALVPFDAKLDKESGCLYSTKLYPGTVVSAMPKVEPKTVTSVAQALYAMSAIEGQKWMYANDFTEVDSLSRKLALGSYAYLQELTPSAIWKRFSTEIILGALLICAAIWHIARVDQLVLRRTNELRETLREKDQLERKAIQSREHLSALEKIALVNQLSSLIAHELKQPLGAVSNYCTGLMYYLKNGNFDTKTIEQILDRIRNQIKQSTDIIDYVRSNAKAKDKQALIEKTNLTEVTHQALETFKLNYRGKCKTRFNALPHTEAEIDPKGIELAVYNLLKNAVEASENQHNPTIQVKIEEDPIHWIVKIEDCGPKLSKEEIERLHKPLSSMKEGGLGLGLTLVKHLLEQNGSRLVFEENQSGLGLTASFKIKKSSPTIQDIVGANNG